MSKIRTLGTSTVFLFFSVLEAALETSSPTEVAHRLLLNHIIPKTWYSVGMDFIGEVTTLGGKKLTMGQSQNGTNLTKLFSPSINHLKN